MKRVILLFVLVLLISSGYSFADVPCKINYQGRLIKDNVPVNEPVNMEFKLYTQETEGEPIKTISINNVPVHNGLFRVVLDLEGVNWAAGETIYLEVKAGTDTLTPREPIYAYPYAINSHLLEGKTTAYFLNTSGDTQQKDGGLNIMGNVGIGTTSPYEKLDIQGAYEFSTSDLQVDAGTSFPSSPATGDRFFRTDRKIWYFYDGTRWLSEQIFTVTVPRHRNVNPVTDNNNLLMPFPWDGGTGNWQIYVLNWEVASYVSTTNDDSNYHTVQIFNGGEAVKDSFDTSGEEPNNWVTIVRDIDGVWTKGTGSEYIYK